MLIQLIDIFKEKSNEDFTYSSSDGGYNLKVGKRESFGHTPEELVLNFINSYMILDNPPSIDTTNS